MNTLFSMVSLLAQASELNEGISTGVKFLMLFLVIIMIICWAWGGYQVTQGTGMNGWLFIVGGTIIGVAGPLAIYFYGKFSKNVHNELPTFGSSHIEIRRTIDQV